MYSGLKSSIINYANNSIFMKNKVTATIYCLLSGILIGAIILIRIIDIRDTLGYERSNKIDLNEEEYLKFRNFASEKCERYGSDFDSSVNAKTRRAVISELSEVEDYARYLVSKSFFHPLRNKKPTKLVFITKENSLYKFVKGSGYRVGSLDGYILKTKDIVNKIKAFAEKKLGYEVDVFDFTYIEFTKFNDLISSSEKYKDLDYCIKGETPEITFVVMKKGKLYRHTLL